MLIPRRVKHRKQHHPSRSGAAKGGTQVTFGDYGIQLSSLPTSPTGRSSPLVSHDSAHQAWRQDLDQHLPGSPPHEEAGRNPNGSGKGSPEWWIANVKPGRVLFEMTYPPNEEIAREALRRAMHKLPCKCRIVTREEQF